MNSIKEMERQMSGKPGKEKLISIIMAVMGIILIAGGVTKL
ncbi:hypothetical protein [Paenibacillus sp. KS1]|nr:hypothetical protein [Paenibacillus sp. KS1]